MGWLFAAIIITIIFGVFVGSYLTSLEEKKLTKLKEYLTANPEGDKEIGLDRVFGYPGGDITFSDKTNFHFRSDQYLNAADKLISQTDNFLISVRQTFYPPENSPNTYISS